jgi:hypothetical protein
MELKMLTKYFGILRSTALAKVRQIDAMSDANSIPLREVGFEALACALLDAFGSLPALHAVSVVLGTPTALFNCDQSATSKNAQDLTISIDRPARIDTIGADVPEWYDAGKVLAELIPLSKTGAGTFTVTRDMPAVQHFLVTVVNKSEDIDLADYRLSVRALAELADHSFGSIRIINEVKG